MNMMTEAERRNSCINANLFGEMVKLVKLVDWDNHEGVKIMMNLGWSYYYDTGIVDRTPYYTRREEDRIRFTNNKYIIQINLSSGGVVFQDIHNSVQFYSNPTLFISIEEIRAISLILQDISVLIKSAKAGLPKKR